MKRLTRAAMNGLTAIELLIITSIIAIIAVFATPMMSSVFFESDLDKAEEITEDSIQTARMAARFYNSDVTLRISASGELARHGITISIPRAGTETQLGVVREEFTLPVTVKIVSGDIMVSFNPDGEVEFPAMVQMATNDGSFERRELIID